MNRADATLDRIRKKGNCKICGKRIPITNTSAKYHDFHSKDGSLKRYYYRKRKQGK